MSTWTFLILLHFEISFYSEFRLYQIHMTITSTILSPGREVVRIVFHSVGINLLRLGMEHRTENDLHRQNFFLFLSAVPILETTLMADATLHRNEKQKAKCPTLKIFGFLFATLCYSTSKMTTIQLFECSLLLLLCWFVIVAVVGFPLFIPPPTNTYAMAATQTYTHDVRAQSQAYHRLTHTSIGYTILMRIRVHYIFHVRLWNVLVNKFFPTHPMWYELRLYSVFRHITLYINAIVISLILVSV